MKMLPEILLNLRFEQRFKNWSTRNFLVKLLVNNMELLKYTSFFLAIASNILMILYASKWVDEEKKEGKEVDEHFNDFF